MPELITGLNFSPHLAKPVPGNVAVRTDRLHAKLIPVVNALRVFFIHGVAHLMARGAELQRVGFFHAPIEAAPEQDSPYTTKHDQGGQHEPAAGPPEHCPKAHQEVLSRRTRSARVAHDAS